MALKVPKLLDMVLEVFRPSYLSNQIRMLLYGETGVGKTWLAAEADDVKGMKPILFLDMDRGVSAVSHRTELDVVPVSGMREMEYVLRFLKGSEHPYKTVVMDGITAFVQSLLDERLLVPDRKGFDAYVPTLQDYLFVTMRIRSVVQALKKGGYHYICTANVRVEKDVSGMSETFPEVVGKQARGIGREFDVVGYMYVNVKPDRTIVRSMQTVPFAARAAKCRGPHPLPPVVVNASMQHLYDHLVKGEYIGTSTSVSGTGKVGAALLQVANQAKENSNAD